MIMIVARLGRMLTMLAFLWCVFTEAAGKSKKNTPPQKKPANIPKAKPSNKPQMKPTNWNRKAHELKVTYHINSTRSTRPTAFVINLDREKNKWNTIVRSFPELNLQRISAIDGTVKGVRGKYALLMTSLNLFSAFLKDSNLPYYMVLEDDIYKTEHWPVLWPAVVNFLLDNTTTWDILTLDPFLGFGSTISHLHNSTVMYQISSFRSMGFVIYSKQFVHRHLRGIIDTLFQGLRHGGVLPLDMSISNDTRFVKLTPQKLLVRQRVNKKSNTANKATPHYESYYERTKWLLNNFSKPI